MWYSPPRDGKPDPYPGIGVLVIILITAGLVYFGNPTPPKEERETRRVAVTTLPSPKASLVSVSPIRSTTCPVDWKMAEVTVRQKRFTIFYDRSEEQELGWNTGPKNMKVTYKIADESNPHGPNNFGSYSPFILKLIRSKGNFNVSGVELLNKDNYSEASGLQAIIIWNDEDSGKDLFEKIFLGLEKIQPPPPLRDE